MARATLKDIAEKAGVSRTTVSYVLNNSPRARISPETRKRVLLASEELDYQPNLVAKGLRTQRTRTIGVLVVNMVVKIFMVTLKGIQCIADEHQYHVLLADTQGRRDKEIGHIKFLAQKGVDGLIIIAASRYADPKLPELLDELNIPTVFVNQPYLADGVPLKAPTVLVDYERAMYEAVRYLIKLGHREIGFLGADLRNFSVKLRRDGYLRAMASAGIEVAPEWVIAEPEGLSTFEFGEEAADRLINTGVTGIVAVNDAVAAGAMRAAEQRGLRVPEELSIIGHDDMDKVAFLRPRLTTIRHPLDRLGRTSFEMLMGLIDNPNNISSIMEPVVLFSDLVVRESTAVPVKRRDAGHLNGGTLGTA